MLYCCIEWLEGVTYMYAFEIVFKTAEMDGQHCASCFTGSLFVSCFSFIDWLFSKCAYKIRYIGYWVELFYVVHDWAISGTGLAKPSVTLFRLCFSVVHVNIGVIFSCIENSKWCLWVIYTTQSKSGWLFNQWTLKGYSGFIFVNYHMLTVDCPMCH